MEFQFRPLNSHSQRLAVFPLYQQLNPRLSQTQFESRMQQLEHEKGYHLLAVFAEEKLVAISGYWIAHKLYCGKYLEPDNVVVDEHFRSQGVGEILQKKLEAIAVENGCEVMMLDAYLDNLAGHKFYERQGYQRKGYHFIKKIC